MTFLQTTYSDKKLVRVQQKGQVTLPMRVREKLGLKKGDLVAVTEIEGGIFISPQQVVANNALNKISEALKEKGLSLDELIDSGREERASIMEKKYGLKAR